MATLTLPRNRRRIPLVAKKAVSTCASLPAPIGGWNARDSIADMAPTDAFQMINWWPLPTDVMQRKGYSNFATHVIDGSTTAVESLIVFTGSTTSAMFATVGTVLYTVTSGGVMSASTISGLANARWQYQNISTAGGNFVITVNGADYPLVYNGTGWDNIQEDAFDTSITSVTRTFGTGTVTVTVTMVSDHHLLTGMSIVKAGTTPADYDNTNAIITVTGAKTYTYTFAAGSDPGAITVVGTATPLNNFAVTGVDPRTFVQINLFKNRWWGIQNNSLKAWYMPTLAIGGAAAAVDMSAIARMGGYLVAMATWTLDAGYGVDDLAVFITSKGEFIVYKGSDPTSPTTWELVGVFQLGPPVGRRCFLKVGGDLALITQDGLIPLAASLLSTRINPKVALTDKIQLATSDAITTYGANFGWDVLYYAKANMLLMNVPVGTGYQQQFVMSTINKSWAQFKGWNANCWALFNDEPYFGGAGIVGKAWDTFADNATNIMSDCQQAFSYYGARGQLKRFTMMRPMLLTNGAAPIFCGLNIDFDLTAPTATFTPTASTAARWDVALWDQGVWSGGLTPQLVWQGVTGIGYAAAPRILLQQMGIETHWAATDVVYERGAIL